LPELNNRLKDLKQINLKRFITVEAHLIHCSMTDLKLGFCQSSVEKTGFQSLLVTHAQWHSMKFTMTLRIYRG